MSDCIASSLFSFSSPCDPPPTGRGLGVGQDPNVKNLPLLPAPCSLLPAPCSLFAVP
ncbi:MAG: hypothetical protein F6J90_07190 [Moorea sp. SIOASIH]|uniref:hypothetical protein n=1 Tax=Moorena sp. SIOASIH TaxID=2607817 RepID=UPI0013BA2B51|nr:hypothetical protein [Moorena sp. SIOASIH]NEO36121.1 hypothetical protein [Moorena sp. SIOASIH]